jgi:RNA polymerase sigma factor (TIGR02999 family)
MADKREMALNAAPAAFGDNESITSLLVAVGHGDRDAEARLVPLVYGELRRVAAANMRRERQNHTLQTTALVNEAWLRLARQPDSSWHDRVHFFAVASRVMRQILVDHARKKRADKRGGAGQFQITLQDRLLGESENIADILALNQALDRLAEFDARAARIVELHFFGGIPFEEMEPIVNVGVRTIRRDWSMARAWLHNELHKQP